MRERIRQVLKRELKELCDELENIRAETTKVERDNDLLTTQN